MNPQFAHWHLFRMLLARNARQALQTRATQTFDLARGALTQLTFVPTAPGYIHATANWACNVTKPLALKMQLIRPDGSVAADAIGCSPLTLHFNIRRDEFQRNSGKTYRIVVLHTVATLNDEHATGDLRVTWGRSATETTTTPTG